MLRSGESCIQHGELPVDYESYDVVVDEHGLPVDFRLWICSAVQSALFDCCVVEVAQRS